MRRVEWCMQNLFKKWFPSFFWSKERAYIESALRKIESDLAKNLKRQKEVEAEGIYNLGSYTGKGYALPSEFQEEYNLYKKLMDALKVNEPKMRKAIKDMKVLLNKQIAIDSEKEKSK